MIGMRELCVLTWAVVASVFLSAQVPAAEAARWTEPAPLSGVVVGPDEEPVPGARVVIWTGSAINDVPLLCPSCYADCGRAERTDALGEFTFEDVDDEVAFRLVIVAEGHHPLHTGYVTPGEAAGTFTLQPREPVVDEARLVRGRVVDAQGRPVADAMVTPRMWWQDGGRSGGSHLDGSDPFAFTGADGRFELAAGRPVHGAALYVQGPVLAPTHVDLVRSGLALEQQPDITLHIGAMVNGRLIGTDGRPLAGVTLNLQSVDRTGGRAYGPVTYGTDDLGRFSFQNVPANTKIEIFGGMEALRGHGVPEPTVLTTAPDDAVSEVGDIRLQPGYTIRGRVVTSDGKPLPAVGRKANLGARADLQRVEIADDGSFAFENVPEGRVTISMQLPGYFISRWNPNRDQNNRSIRGAVVGDLDDFVVLMEPGIEPWQANGHGLRSGERVPTLRGIDEPLPAIVGGRLATVSIHPQADDATGWPEYPWHASLLLPVGTSADNPRAIEVSASDPTRPYLPAARWTLEATRDVVGLSWAEAFPDARVLAFEVADGDQRTRRLVDRGGVGMRAFVVHEPQEAAGEHLALGRVLDASGAPVAGARVTPMAFWQGGTGRLPWPGGTRLTATNEHGTFGVGASEPYDRVQVRVLAPGHPEQVFDMVTKAGRQDIDLRRPARLTLTAHGRTGEPAGHAVATLWRRDQTMRWYVQAVAHADKSGRVVFESAPTGEGLRVIIEDSARGGTALWGVVEIDPIQGEAHDAGIAKALAPATITGQLVARVSLALAERPALVLHRLATDERLTVRPDDDGTFVFPPVPAGEAYAISYHGPGYLHPAHAATVQGFAAGCTAVGGRLGGDTHLRLLVQPTHDGGPTPQFVGQQFDKPLSSVASDAGLSVVR